MSETDRRQPQWLDMEEAARRSGRSLGQLRRRCAEEWMAKRLAKLERPDNGSRSRWIVREDADAMFARVQFPEEIAFDVNLLAARHREELFARKRILDGWMEARAGGLAAGILEPEVSVRYLQQLMVKESRSISRATLFNWHAAWRAGGLGGLVDGRWPLASKAATKAEDPFLAESRHWYGQRPALTKATCYKLALAKARVEGWSVPSARTVARFLENLNPAWVAQHRGGPVTYKNEHKPYHERDYETLRVNQLWCGDHHEFDVRVSHEGKLTRPWLTAWQDLRSRKIVGWAVYAGSPNQNWILLALRSGVLEHGIPDGVYIDNGKDYDSYALQGQTKKQRQKGVAYNANFVGGVLGNLKCKVIHATPYHPQAKPIERFFGTVCSQFSRLFRTYCGKSTSDKPEGLKEREEAGQAPTLEEFQEKFAGWLESVYHTSPHGGHGMDGRCPADVFAQLLDSKRTATPEQLEVFCLKTTQPIRVTQNGVRHNGLQYGAGDVALLQHRGREVYLRYDPANIARVSVWSLDDTLLCVVESNLRMGFEPSEEEWRSAKSRFKGHEKQVREMYESPMRLAVDPVDVLVQDRAERRAAEAVKPAEPPAVRPHQSPVGDQANAVRKAFERVEKQTRNTEQAESIDLLGILEDRGREAIARPVEEFKVDLLGMDD